jgi:hypothetical protein
MRSCRLRTRWSRAQLRVEAPQAPAGAEFVVLDAQGQRLTIRQFMHQGYITRDHWPLSDGRSQVLTVSYRARTVVLRHDGKELGRRDLTLWPGSVTEVHF